MRRPLRVWELPHLRNLGRLLRANRLGAGHWAQLTQAQLGLLAGLSRVQVARIEAGTSRTRRSTLRRLAAALVVVNPSLGPAERLADDLADAAGPALAEESRYSERITRRRAVRTDKAWRADLRAAEARLADDTFRRWRSEWWSWRPQEEKIEMWVESRRDFDAHRDRLEQQRRAVERMS